MDVNDDLFDDAAPTPSEGESPTFTKTPEDPKSAEEPKPSIQGEEGVETPATEDLEVPSEKFIPEHRFKAALKDVTESRDKATKELEELRAQLASANPTVVPDREADPDGYELHVRIETSKAVMAATHADYNDVITHYQEMVADNPYLNEAVANHPVPAQHAYNIAKKDMEIKELMMLKDSADWKEFQEFKQQKSEQVEKPKVTLKVPNVNRVAAVNAIKGSSRESDDDLFAGAL